MPSNGTFRVTSYVTSIGQSVSRGIEALRCLYVDAMVKGKGHKGGGRCKARNIDWILVPTSGRSGQLKMEAGLGKSDTLDWVLLLW